MGQWGVKFPHDPMHCWWVTLGARYPCLPNLPIASYILNTYLSTVPLKEQTSFNTVGSPLGLHLGKCMCRALLQVANLSKERKWQYGGSCLIILHGAQFSNRFPTIFEPHNHSPLLKDAEGVPYPMEAVGDFTLEDKIFPGILGDTLLFDSPKLVRLQQKNYNIPRHLPQVPLIGHPSNTASRDALSLSVFDLDAEGQNREVTPLVAPSCHPQDSMDGKKSHHHCSHKGRALPKKKDEAKCKESDSTSSKKSHGS